MNKKHLIICLAVALLPSIDCTGLAQSLIGQLPQTTEAQNSAYQHLGFGALPSNGVVQNTDGWFYGWAAAGGKYHNGTLFKFHVGASTTLVTLHTFREQVDITSNLVPDGHGWLYGTTLWGGKYGQGTVFKVNGQGTVVTIYSFGTSKTDGSGPLGLARGRDGNFYGTTSGVGTKGDVQAVYWNATIYRITPSGQIKLLHMFPPHSEYTPSFSSLIEGRDGDFYGTMQIDVDREEHGYVYSASVFRISPNGVFRNLRTFDWGAISGLVLDKDGNFYGVGNSGRHYEDGILFKINQSGFISVIRTLKGITGQRPTYSLVSRGDGRFYGPTNADSATRATSALWSITLFGELSTLFTESMTHPAAIVSSPSTLVSGLYRGLDDNFYGVDTYGGKYGAGRLFKVIPSGKIVTLFSFSDMYPEGSE